MRAEAISAGVWLFVGGVGSDVTEPQLRTAFAEAGVPLARVELIVNHMTGLKRGFAFVYVDSRQIGPASTIEAAIERMGGVTVNGHPSIVRRLIPAPDSRSN